MKNLRSFLMLLLMSLIFQSCHFSTNSTAVNDSIDQKTRDEINLLNEKLWKALVNNDLPVIKPMLSDALLEKTPNLEEICKTVASGIDPSGFTKLDEYQIENSAVGLTSSLRPIHPTKDNYSLNFKVLSKNTFVSLLLPKDKNMGTLFIVIYGKYGNDWKINVIQFGEYRIQDKTAADFYELAKTQYTKGYLINAVNYISLAKRCVKPAGDYLTFANEKEISAYSTKIFDEVRMKFPLPLTVNEVATQPAIFAVVPVPLENTIAPLISYVSKINLKDTIALKAENIALRETIYQKFIGINKEKKLVLFRVYNEQPSPGKTSSYYGFIDKLTTD